LKHGFDDPLDHFDRKQIFHAADGGTHNRGFRVFLDRFSPQRAIALISFLARSGFSKTCPVRAYRKVDRRRAGIVDGPRLPPTKDDGPAPCSTTTTPGARRGL